MADQSLNVDGSSTVYVISEAIAEEFHKSYPTKVSIGVSGTGGGFKKLCSGRVDIIGASRAITESEKSLCLSNQIKWLELPVAYDGIVVAVNPKNDWIINLPTATLKKLFEPAAEGKIKTWKDLNPAWPDREIQIFAPGVSSGTYDYFTQSIVGTEHASRGDITTSEDDNVLVQGVANNLDALGFFSYAYYQENREMLRVVPIIDTAKNTATAVMPSVETIQSGEYSPLSRLVYIYANQNLTRVDALPFLTFFLENSGRIAPQVGFIALTKAKADESMAQLKGL